MVTLSLLLFKDIYLRTKLRWCGITAGLNDLIEEQVVRRSGTIDDF